MARTQTSTSVIILFASTILRRCRRSGINHEGIRLQLFQLAACITLAGVTSVKLKRSCGNIKRRSECSNFATSKDSAVSTNFNAVSPTLALLPGFNRFLLFLQSSYAQPGATLVALTCTGTISLTGGALTAATAAAIRWCPWSSRGCCVLCLLHGCGED